MFQRNAPGLPWNVKRKKKKKAISKPHVYVLKHRKSCLNRFKTIIGSFPVLIMSYNPELSIYTPVEILLQLPMRTIHPLPETGICVNKSNL
jgi:hypothetical protein